MNTHEHHLEHLKVCPWLSLRIDYHPQFPRLAKIMDLANLTYLTTNHLRWDNYAATYAEN